LQELDIRPKHIQSPIEHIDHVGGVSKETAVCFNPFTLRVHVERKSKENLGGRAELKEAGEAENSCQLDTPME
jgi:hypothetical protein